MTTREVRADQHGTITGYVYGCRCNACRIARREYAREYSHESVSAGIALNVLAALEREADMDGIVTASAKRLGELAGISHHSAAKAVRQLASEGRVEVIGRLDTRGGVLEIRVDGAA